MFCCYSCSQFVVPTEELISMKMVSSKPDSTYLKMLNDFTVQKKTFFEQTLNGYEACVQNDLSIQTLQTAQNEKKWGFW